MVDNSRYVKLPKTFTAELTFRADVSGWKHLMGPGNNRTRGMQRAFYRAHLKMARRVQEYAAEELEEARSPRARRSGSLLTQAIRNERNRDVTPQGFQVGSEQWLFHDSPAKRYARRIEWGGPNPMSKVGGVRARFYSPGGFTSFGDGVNQGRVSWFSAWGRSGYHFKPDDVVSDGGYRLHERAGQRFKTNEDLIGIYQRYLYEDSGLSWVNLRRATTGTP